VALTQFANWTTLAAYINSNPSSPMQMHWSLMSEYFDAQLASGASFPLLAPGTDFVRAIVLFGACCGLVIASSAVASASDVVGCDSCSLCRVV
jgi:hypothetical protein